MPVCRSDKYILVISWHDHNCPLDGHMSVESFAHIKNVTPKLGGIDSIAERIQSIPKNGNHHRWRRNRRLQRWYRSAQSRTHSNGSSGLLQVYQRFLSKFRPANTCADKPVKILEQSALLQETEAAISIAPNASPVLRSWGFDPAKSRMVAIKTGSILNGSTMQMMVPNYYANIEEKYGVPVYSVHRVDLHEQLKALAAGEDGPGLPCKLHIRAAVVDCVSCTLTSQNCSYPAGNFWLCKLGCRQCKSSPCRRHSQAGGPDHCSEWCPLDG